MTDCEDDEDISRGQSPMIPLTIEKSVAIKAEPSDTEFLESVKNEDYEDDEDNEEEDKLNSSLTAMDWLPRLNARAGVVEEYIPEEERKPPYSYASLIRLAILNSPNQKATLSDIYRWIQDKFIYYKNQVNLGWKNSIRHNLSLNKCFMKVARSRHDPGKGCYWAINQLFSQDKTPFEKKKKNFLLPSEIFKQDMTELQRTFLQTLQARQLQMILSEQGATLSGPQSLYPGSDPGPASDPSNPVSSQGSGLLPTFSVEDSKPRLETSTMLLDDWATTSEADLSQSLSRIMTQPPLVMESPLLVKPSDQEDSIAMMNTGMPGLSSSWPAIKTEASVYNCINPMEIQVSFKDFYLPYEDPMPKPCLPRSLEVRSLNCPESWATVSVRLARTRASCRASGLTWAACPGSGPTSTSSTGGG